MSGELKSERGRVVSGEIFDADPPSGICATERANTTLMVHEASASQHFARIGVLHSSVLEDCSDDAAVS